jgi:DNA-binding response OmpR family regulator
MRVLVIEDNGDLRDYLRVALEGQGYEVRTADNGRTALPYLEDHAVDVVVTDIYMPEMDGIETLAMLQQRFPRVRVIAMSGKPATHVPVMQELGAAKVLKKPFTMDELFDALEATAA